MSWSRAEPSGREDQHVDGQRLKWVSVFAEGEEAREAQQGRTAGDEVRPAMGRDRSAL